MKLCEDDLERIEKINCLASKLNKINKKEKSILIENIENIQNEMMIQEKIKNDSIKLVAFDTSRTLITYTSNNQLKKNASKKICELLNSYGINVTQKKVIESIKNGFLNYAKFREINSIEEDEMAVYETYIFPLINLKINALPYVVKEDIIHVWCEFSVDISLTCTNIKDIIKELKIRNIQVVTISDMLGGMVKRALKALGIYDIFDAHFVSNEFNYRKKSKNNSLFSIVNNVCKVSSVNSLMIGNSYQDDIVPSFLLGWKTIFVNFNSDKKYDSEICNYNIGHTDDFLSIIKSEDSPFNKLNVDSFTDKIAKRNDTEDSKIRFEIRNLAKFICDREQRELVYRNYLLNKCGSSTRLGINIEVRHADKILIGDNCQINDNVTILNEGNVLIGNNVMIAYGVFISTFYHDWRLGMNQTNKLSWAKGNTKVGVVSIGSNSWIGPYSCFESEVILGKNCVVAAHTLVKKGIYPDYSFIAGSPGRIIKNIKDEVEMVGKAFVTE